MKTRVKICCMHSVAEARLAVSLGAAAVGMVGAMPSGPGPIDDELIRCIAASVPPPVATFLLTCETGAGEIVAHHRRTLTNAIQLVDAPEPGAVASVRAELPAIRIVRVVHVRKEESVDEALRAAEEADALLLDSGNPDLSVKQLGGTGRVHDWRLSRRIVELSPKPVFLAGGLKPENVRAAIEQVGPFGVDLCTGVRTGNRLDPRKLEAFFREVGKANK